MRWLALLIALPMLAHAQWDGMPPAVYATNYLTWEEYDAEYGEHPFAQCVSALHERQDVAGVSRLSIVHSGVLIGSPINPVSITLTNTWGWFTNSGYVGYENVTYMDIHLFDDALRTVIPSFCDTNYYGRTNMAGTYADPIFPKWTPSSICLSNGVGYPVTNTDAYTYLNMRLTRWQADAANLLLCQKSYDGTWHRAGIWYDWASQGYELDRVYYGDAKPVLWYNAATDLVSGVAVVSGWMWNAGMYSEYITSEVVSVSSEYTPLSLTWKGVFNIIYTNTPNTGDVFSVMYTNAISIYDGYHVSDAGGGWAGVWREEFYNLMPVLFDERYAVLNAMVSTEADGLSVYTKRHWVYGWAVTNGGGSFVTAVNANSGTGDFLWTNTLSTMYPSALTAMGAAWNPASALGNLTNTSGTSEEATQTSNEQGPFSTNRNFILYLYGKNRVQSNVPVTNSFAHDSELLVRYDGAWSITNTFGSYGASTVTVDIVANAPTNLFPVTYSAGNGQWSHAATKGNWRIWWNVTNGFLYK